MSFEHIDRPKPTPELIETRIVSMYDKSLAGYIAYLESDQPPYGLQERTWYIGSSGYGLFFAAAAKLAQQHGINSRINFVEHPHTATLSYASNSGHADEMAFLDRNKENRDNHVLSSLLLDNSDAYITAVAAIRADISIEELLWGYMHFSDDEIKIIEDRYTVAEKACKQDPDLFFRFVLQKHMRDYVDRGIFSLIDGGLAVSAASKHLRSITGKLDDEATARYDREMTNATSTRNYMHMRYRTVEDLVNSGYTPLSPEEYEDVLREIFLQ